MGHLKKEQCHFNYIETTYEPIMNLSVPLDDSSLDPNPISRSNVIQWRRSQFKDTCWQSGQLYQNCDWCTKQTFRLYLNKVGLAVCTWKHPYWLEEDEADFKPPLNNRNIHKTFRLLAYIHQSLVHTKLNF